MPLPHDHFNSNSRPFDTAQHRAAEGPSVAVSRPHTAKPSNKSGGFAAFIRNPVGQATAMAVLYGIDGFMDFQRQNDYYGTPEVWPMDLAFISVVVGLPAFLMFKRKGYVSAGVLCLTALMNIGGIWQEVAAGNELYEPGAIIWHLIALAVFVRAGLHLWKARNS